MTLEKWIIFGGGAIAGFFTAKLVLEDKYKKKYMKEADEKVASMQEYVDKMRELDKRGQLLYNLEHMGKASEPGKLERAVDGGSADPRVGKEAVKYTSMYANPASVAAVGAVVDEFMKDAARYEHPEDDEPENYEATEMRKSHRGEKPRLISSVEYDDYRWHDKTPLIYYTEDKCLVTEKGNELVDIEECVGDCLSKFGFDKSEEEHIYVRNFQRGEDFEITKCWGNWEG